MTSLIDILTLLLVFLIQSFSAEGNLITPSEDLQLPLSSSSQMPAPALTIEITKTNVQSEGMPIAAISSFEKSESFSIRNLGRFLAEQKRLAGPQMKPKVIIQCDRDVVFNVVKRVMYTCTESGFSNFSVLAIED